jgi:hypothetical protein
MMMTSQFTNPTDEYFVTTVLRACLLLIISTFFAHLIAFVLMFSWIYLRFYTVLPAMENWIKTISSFPIVEMGIYSMAIFVAGPSFDQWPEFMAILLIFPTLRYWMKFLKGPIRNLHQFALFHQVKSNRINSVLSPFYLSAYIDYYFVVLKKTLLPLVFILVVMDFRIILPRLVDAGMSFSAFVMFFSLIVSLHLLTTNKGREV